MNSPRDIVLVVDDSPGTLGMLNETLETAGFTVLVAQAGQVALDLVDRVTPDIVLMDALMPGLDGFETCRRMKQKPGLSAVPIVFMTGLTETEHVIRGLEEADTDAKRIQALAGTPPEMIQDERYTQHQAAHLAVGGSQQTGR